MRTYAPYPLYLVLFLLIVAQIAGCGQSSSEVQFDQNKPRVVVTTDPELDDSNSLVRYLLYSTDVQTEGLVYASSQYHWKGDGEGTTWSVPGREYTRFGLDICPCTSWRWAEGERFIHDAVETYEQVYPNLVVHDPAYPSPEELKAKIRVGNIEFDGDISEDTPGSDLIKSLLLDDSNEPLYLLAWGGQSTIARALKSIKDEYQGASEWPSLQQRVTSKAVILAFGDQDDTFVNYIEPNWPGLELRRKENQTYGYGARGAVLPADQMYLSAEWTREHVSGQGPFGAFYRVWGDGKQMVEGDIFDFFGYAGLSDDTLRARGYVVWMPSQEEGSWISEGDTPTFLNLINNGLRGHEDASFGGWGGRKGIDEGPSGPNPDYAMARFFGASQRDFSARLRWSVTPEFDAVNHPPVVEISGALDLVAAPGETVSLAGLVSDPDGDEVQVTWWQHVAAGSFPGRVEVEDALSLATRVRVPDNATAGQTLHFILEATDSGMPRLSRYQRVIIRVADV